MHPKTEVMSLSDARGALDSKGVSGPSDYRGSEMTRSSHESAKLPIVPREYI